MRLRATAQLGEVRLVRQEREGEPQNDGEHGGGERAIRRVPAIPHEYSDREGDVRESDNAVGSAGERYPQYWAIP